MKSKKDRAKFTVLCMFMAILTISISLNLTQSRRLNQHDRQMRQMLKDYIELNHQCRQMDSIVSSMDTIIHTLLDKMAEQNALPLTKE